MHIFIKRPDGCTLIPWRAGRCLAWDVTVPGTLAERYVNLTSKECGLAAARAADEKMKKYGSALPSMEFLPIRIEVLGPMDPNTLKFLKEIGKMISVRSVRSKGKLGQHKDGVSVCYIFDNRQRRITKATRQAVPDSRTH
ncbi:hypothetical protein HELRODRAFT_182772 [Helobdella robusta]|uniref:Uncharacterized protein n=1 Tax=Helobdella robusta TaxID=6412 RepID=T1FIP8_HELRO|nr:hypothetical protein HELRODRAFT_182772 [Helobdella robusta]ESN90170.1 hypothetical protein HELRODRAFT_182772 [Helobdella robusta]